MKNVTVTIKSTQEINGESDNTEFISEGKYNYSLLGSEVIYDESVTLGISNVVTKLNVNNNNVVSLLRNEGKFGNLVIEKNVRHMCNYHTQYGFLNIGILGDTVECNLNENGGNILLKYSIDVESGLLSKNTVNIKISEV